MSYNREALETLFERYCNEEHPTKNHLPAIRYFAERCDLAVEFGTHVGRSAVALLLSARRVISFDIKEQPQAKAIQKIAGKTYWSYRIEDTRTAIVPPCDLLFVDSLHTYDQVSAELDAHADKVGKRIIFHDTISYGINGEGGGKLTGIRHAIDELMIRDPSWRIEWATRIRHGLLVLRREGLPPVPPDELQEFCESYVRS